MATNNSNRWSNFKTNNSVLGGRYDRGQVYGQRINNDITSQKAWATDPWFQLGSSIGQSWGDAYNERGISKGRNEMNEALNGYLGQFASQPKTDVEQGGMFNNNMPGTMPSEEMLNNNSAQIQGGVLGGLDNVITPMTPQEAYKAYKNDAWVSKYRGDDPNPDGSAISVKNDTQQMNQLASSVDFGKVDKEQAREYVRQQLEQKGRTPYQIDQVLGNFDSIYDSKYGKWKENKGTTFLQNGINALNGDNPDYKNALMNMYAAAEYGNPQAKMYIQQIQYERARQDKIDAENRAFERQKSLLDYKQSIGIGRGGRSSGGSSNGQSNGTLANYNSGRWIGRKDAVTHQEHADALAFLKYADGLEELKPEQKVAYNHAMDVVNKYNSQNHGGVRGYNIDSPDDVANYIRGVAYNVKNNPNVSGTDILNTLRNDGIMASPYWDDKYLELLGLSADGTNEE